MLTRTITSALRDYTVFYSKGFEFLKDIGEIEGPFYVIDRKVYKLYSEQFSMIPYERLYLFDACEENKFFPAVTALYETLITKDFTRNNTLISIGGGITQDVTGFVASTLYRGVEWIYIPTTLLAQADSCIGGKTSLNFLGYKNLLGTFYPPHKVYVDTAFIKTLTQYDFYNGIGEMIKLLFLDRKQKRAVDNIECLKRCPKENAEELLSGIEQSHSIKIDYIESDEFDGGVRNMLNFGHCFGHAFEVSSNYKIPHGMAVVVGMIYANIASKKRRMMSPETCGEINRRCLLGVLPARFEKSFFDHDNLLSAMKRDKKRTGTDLTLIVLDGDRRPVRLSDFTVANFAECLAEIQQLLFEGDQDDNETF